PRPKPRKTPPRRRRPRARRKPKPPRPRARKSPKAKARPRATKPRNKAHALNKSPAPAGLFFGAAGLAGMLLVFGPAVIDRFAHFDRLLANVRHEFLEVLQLPIRR